MFFRIILYLVGYLKENWIGYLSKNCEIKSMICNGHDVSLRIYCDQFVIFGITSSSLEKGDNEL